MFTVNQMARALLFFVLFVVATSTLKAQYLETFSTPNKGYLTGNTNDFSGVGWTLSPWDNGNRDANDYFQTTASGVLESIDLDEEVCWESPLINISAAGTVSFGVGLSWVGFDPDVVANTCILFPGAAVLDYIRVMYSVNGGVYQMVPNQVGGAVCATIGYTGNQVGPFNSSTTVNQGGISGNTLKIRVCVGTNANAEVVTIDNVSVPQSGVTTGCAAPTLGIATTQAGSCNSANGTIKVTATGGTPGYNVAWGGTSSGNPGGTEIASSGGMYTISPLATGAYTITVTDGASCSATATATVTTASPLSPQTQVLNTTCLGVNDGEIDLTVNNGVPPYTYSWSNLPGSPDPQDQTGLATGTYTVTVTDAAGCTATTSATVGVAPLGAYLETFSVAGKGYLPNFVDNFAGVNWTLSNWPLDPFGRDNEDYFQTSGGVLTAIDLDQEVCWTSPAIDINPPGSGIAFSVDLAWTGFDNEPNDYINVKYSLNGGGYTTVPNAVGGGVGTIQYNSGTNNNGSTTISVNSLSGNTLQIQICGNFNVNAETITIDNVSVPGSQGLACPCPAITFTATPTSTCSGASNGQIAVSNVNGGTGPYTYSKDNGATFQPGATFTGLAAGPYNIVVKDNNGCTSAPVQVTVSTLAAPSCTITGPDPACSNTSGITYLAPPGMSNYNWSIAGAGSINGATDGQSVSVTSGNFLSNFTLTVTVTNANGCTSVCNKQVDIFLPKPPADITVNANPICLGPLLNLSVTAASSSTVFWTGEGIANPNGNPSTTAQPQSAGQKLYTVVITTDQGCSNTDDVLVTVNPTPIVTPVQSVTYCASSTTQAINLSSSIPNATLSWSRTIPNPDIGPLPANGVGNIPSFLTSSPGVGPIISTFSVVASATTNNFTCNSPPVQFTLTVAPKPVVNPVSNKVYCDGAVVPAINFSGTGSTYNWSRTTPNPDIGMVPTNGTGSIPSFTATNPGTTPIISTVTVEAASTTNGVTCTGAPIQFTITILPKPVIDPVSAKTYCDGENVPSVVFTSNVPGAAFAWSRTVPNPDIGLGATFGNGNVPAFVASNPSLNPIISTFSVVASTTVNGVSCPGPPIQFTMTIEPDIPVNITYSSFFCMDDPGPVIGLSNSIAGVTYQLQDNGGNNLGAPRIGTGGPLYFGSYPNGTYKVVATQGNCMGEATANVNANGIACGISVPDYCTCNSPDGYTPVTIKIGAPDGQNWTVKDVIGLYSPVNPFPPIAIGTPLQPIGGGMYTLDAARSNTKGFWVQVTNGFTDFDVQVGNPSW